MLLRKLFPRGFVGDLAEWIINFIEVNLSGFFTMLTNLLEFFLGNLLWAFSALPIWGVIVITAGLIYLKTRRFITTLLVIFGLYLIYTMYLWEEFLETVSLMVVAIFMALLIGIPLGILMGKIKLIDVIFTPVLDFMQTMHPFVYLIPVVFIFGLGMVPGVIVTTIFAIPPPARLVSLGIKQVDRRYIEAGEAFGATPLQLLFRVEIPLAMPSIITGINQCIMLSLSMVIIAAMIASGGLGEEITRAISRLAVGPGIEAGLAVVILGMILDRLTTS